MQPNADFAYINMAFIYNDRIIFAHVDGHKNSSAETEFVHAGRKLFNLANIRHTRVLAEYAGPPPVVCAQLEANMKDLLKARYYRMVYIADAPDVINNPGIAVLLQTLFEDKYILTGIVDIPLGNGDIDKAQRELNISRISIPMPLFILKECGSMGSIMFGYGRQNVEEETVAENIITTHKQHVFTYCSRIVEGLYVLWASYESPLQKILNEDPGTDRISMLIQERAKENGSVYTETCIARAYPGLHYYSIMECNKLEQDIYKVDEMIKQL